MTDARDNWESTLSSHAVIDAIAMLVLDGDSRKRVIDEMSKVFGDNHPKARYIGAIIVATENGDTIENVAAAGIEAYWKARKRS